MGSIKKIRTGKKAWLYIVLGAMALSLVLVSCGGGGGGYGGGGMGMAILISISVTPTNPSIATPNTQQFTATGTYSNYVMQKITTAVTWSSSMTGVATINSQGLATCVATGNTNIKAMSGSTSGMTGLTCT